MANAELPGDDHDKDNFVDELKPGTKLLHGQYTIERFLNAGGFGITYLARDSLDRKVVIKECFPGAFCRRSQYIVQARSRAHQAELQSIVRLFIQEARSLAKLQHPNIVGVHQVFEDNDTAYMALDFVEGQDMLEMIEEGNSTITPAQLKDILKAILSAVGFIHDQGILHRDISPDNILINQNLHPVLIDFGAAREEATKQSRVLSALRVVKDGYSPQEFYIAGSEQTPSSDLYALGASFYHAIAGETPPNSQARLAAIASGEADPYVPLKGNFKGFDANFLGAIDESLKVLPKDRVQSAQDWLTMMEGGKVKAAPAAPSKKAAAAAPATSAAPAGGQKSNMPILLGSAAAVALLVGVGAFMMMGGEDPAPAAVTQAPAVTPAPAPAVETVEAETPSPAETPAEPEAAVDTATIENLLTEETATDPVATADATVEDLLADVLAGSGSQEATETAAIVGSDLLQDTPSVNAPAVGTGLDVAVSSPSDSPVVLESDTLAESTTSAGAIAEVDLVGADVFVGSNINLPDAPQFGSVTLASLSPATQMDAETRPALIMASMLSRPSRATEPRVVTSDDPQIVAEPRLVALGAVNSAASGIVSLQEMNDSATPAIQVSADTTGTVQLSETATGIRTRPAAATPRITGNSTDSAAPLPAVSASAPLEGDATPAMTMPQTPSVVLASALPTGTEIPAFTPGNELVRPAYEVGLTVSLPFTSAEPGGNAIGEVDTIAPAWARRGVVVQSVNGTPINAINEIPSALAVEIAANGDGATIVAMFQILDPATGASTVAPWVLPIRQSIALANGLTFETAYSGNSWQTLVAELPPQNNSGLQKGDILASYIPTSQQMTEKTSLLDILDRELENGTERLMFAVSRGESLWVAQFSVGGDS